jgi:hypothetical protein
MRAKIMTQQLDPDILDQAIEQAADHGMELHEYLKFLLDEDRIDISEARENVE